MATIWILPYGINMVFAIYFQYGYNMVQYGYNIVTIWQTQYGYNMAITWYMPCGYHIKTEHLQEHCHIVTIYHIW